MSTDQTSLHEIVRVLQGVEQRVRFPVEGEPEIGAANDIASMIAKLKKLAAAPTKKLHLIIVEPNNGDRTHYVAVLAETASQADALARRHLGGGVAAVTPLVVDSGIASISIPKAADRATVRID